MRLLLAALLALQAPVAQAAGRIMVNPIAAIEAADPVNPTGQWNFSVPPFGVGGGTVATRIPVIGTGTDVDPVRLNDEIALSTAALQIAVDGKVSKGGDTMVGDLTLGANAVLNMNTSGGAPAHLRGRVFYSTTHEALAYYNDDSGVTVLIGHDQVFRAKNKTGSTITPGQAVYVSGASGGTKEVLLAQADAHGSSHALGLAITSVNNNQVGYFVITGEIGGLDTTAFSEGDEVYLSTSIAGALTNIAPPSSEFVVHIGVVTNSNPSNGSIEMLIHIDHPSLGITETIRSTAQLQTEACIGYPGLRCRVYNSSDDDIYTSTGSAVGSWRNTRTGLPPL